MGSNLGVVSVIGVLLGKCRVENALTELAKLFWVVTDILVLVLFVPNIRENIVESKGNDGYGWSG
jgi:hypothetical protein